MHRAGDRNLGRDSMCSGRTVIGMRTIMMEDGYSNRRNLKNQTVTASVRSSESTYSKLTFEYHTYRVPSWRSLLEQIRLTGLRHCQIQRFHQRRLEIRLFCSNEKHRLTVYTSADSIRTATVIMAAKKTRTPMERQRT